jgi:hypothetical protein
MQAAGGGEEDKLSRGISPHATICRMRVSLRYAG